VNTVVVINQHVGDLSADASSNECDVAIHDAPRLPAVLEHTCPRGREKSLKNLHHDRKREQRIGLKPPSLDIAPEARPLARGEVLDFLGRRFRTCLRDWILQNSNSAQRPTLVRRI